MSDDRCESCGYSTHPELGHSVFMCRSILAQERTKLRAELQRLEQGNGLTRFDEMRYRVLQEENARLRDELNEQARINGMGSEREAKLRAALEFFEAYHRATDPVIAVRAREALERD